jgi:hypothetical protein
VTGPRETLPSPEPIALLYELARSLLALAEAVPGLSVEDTESGAHGPLVADQRGVVISYRPPDGNSQVRVGITGRRIKIRTRSLGAGDAWAQLEDRLVITLGHPSLLLGRAYESIPDLATTVVGLMKLRASHVDLAGWRPEPPGTQLVGTRRGARTPSASSRDAGRPV